MRYLTEINKYKIHSEEDLNKYAELIERNNGAVFDCYTERHHILPRSLFPEFANDSWNIVELTMDDHIEAHRLLHSIFESNKTLLAYMFMNRMAGTIPSRELYITFRKSMSGEGNPAKREESRKKISASKTGKKRPDMLGKRYFGASEEAAKNGIRRMTDALAGTVVVKNSDGEKFRVSMTDPRYISGELRSINAGESRPNSAMKNSEYKKRQLESRSRGYEKFKSFSLEEMIDFLVSRYNEGAIIFHKKDPNRLSSNYTYFVKLSGLDINDVIRCVVQRLEKDRVSTLNRVS
jgi:hypothetical protein